MKPARSARSYEINVVLQLGVRQFVVYQAQTLDRTIFHQFPGQLCGRHRRLPFADAEVVFATLTSVVKSQATLVP